MYIAVIVNTGCTTARETLNKVQGVDAVVYLGNHICMANLESMNSVKSRVFAIPGPEDEAHIIRWLTARGYNIDGRIVTLKDTKIGGIGGVDPATSLDKLRRMVEYSGVRLDVLVSYYPPSMVTGKNRGSLAVKEVLEYAKASIAVTLDEKMSLRIYHSYRDRQYIIAEIEDTRHRGVVLSRNNDRKNWVLRTITR